MPYKVSFYIFLFLVFFNGGVVFLESVGADDYLGIAFDEGDTSEIQQAESQAEQFETGTGQGQTLIGTYNRLAGVFNDFINAVQPGKQMLEANGVPASVTGFLWSGMLSILGWDAAKFIRRG